MSEFETQIEKARREVYADCDRIDSVVEVRIQMGRGRWPHTYSGFVQEWIARRESVEQDGQRRLEDRAVAAAERSAEASVRSARWAMYAAIAAVLAIIATVLPEFMRRL